MTDIRAYSSFHPRWYRKRVSTYWWAEKWPYLLFILRELSSIFVAWLVVFLLLLVRAVNGGEAQYQDFLAWAARPAILAINGVSLAFVLLHVITWFNLAPQAMVISLKGRRVPGVLIAGANYAAWVAVSLFLAWLLLGRLAPGGVQ